MVKRTVMALIPLLGVTLSAAADASSYEDGLRAHLLGHTEQALEIWQRGAARGETDAQFSLGLLYASGSGVQKDIDEALKWWKHAADAGDVRAQMNLAATFSTSPAFFDLEAAEYWYAQAAQNHSAAAQTQLGDIKLLYRDDTESARIEYLKAFAMGDVLAPHRLAELALGGVTGTESIVSAESWLVEGVENDYAPSQYSLGKMHLMGLTSNPDAQEGVALIVEAANQGFSPAEYNVGKLYRDGQFVERNAELAVSWFERPAKGGHSSAQLALARRYLFGEGVEADYVKALAWAIVAQRSGNKEAELLTETIRKSAPEQDHVRAEIEADSIQEGVRAGYSYATLAAPLTLDELE